jgi:hypothetical protein
MDGPPGFLYPETLVFANDLCTGKSLVNGLTLTIQCGREECTVGRRSQDVGRKVPRSSYERDRREILKQVPKLRKIKPGKGK